jgi:predicted RNA-binding Zn ribbon-like protein
MSYSLGRYSRVSAPAGLVLVQELLNTREIRGKGADLLADRETAAAWLGEALGLWSERTGIPVAAGATAVSDSELRELRRSVERAVDAAGHPAPPATAVTIVAAADGALRVAPRGSGIEWMASAVWGEILTAMQADTWKRLKVCRNEACASAFYDRSRNSSGVWHDVRTCGNVANLRASRSRRAPAEMR